MMSLALDDHVGAAARGSHGADIHRHDSREEKGHITWRREIEQVNGGENGQRWLTETQRRFDKRNERQRHWDEETGEIRPRPSH
jgi:hypothetical protein